MKGKTLLFITFSDLHLEIWKNHNEGNRRLKNALDVLRRIALICKKRGAISLFIGDLFHKEQGLTNSILDLCLPFLAKIWKGKFITIAISGNHDQSKQNFIKNESPSYVKTLSKIFKGLICIDFSKYSHGDIDIYGVPYITHDLGLIDYINNLKLEKGKKNILMIHTTMPNAKDTDGREVHSNLHQTEFYDALKRFDLVLCGHIHSPFSFKIGKTTVIQVGAPQQQRLTDKNQDMGYWEIYDDLSVKFVPFKDYPKFIEIDNLSEKLNDKNFYVIKPKKREIKEREVKSSNFSNTSSRSKLAKSYCKEKNIKDKSKKEALIQTLKSVE